MTVNTKPTGRASSIPAGLAWGVAAALAGTLAGAAVTASLIDRGVMGWDKSGYGVLVILVASAWMGSAVAAAKIKRQRFAACLGTGAVYFCSLMIMTALFFGGQYSGVGETALLIFCGSMLGVLGRYPGKTRRNAGKIRVRHR